MKCVCCYNDHSTGGRINFLPCLHAQPWALLLPFPAVLPSYSGVFFILLYWIAILLLGRSERQQDGISVESFYCHSVSTVLRMEFWQAPLPLFPALTGKLPSDSLQDRDLTSETFWSKGDDLIIWVSSEVQTGMLAPIGTYIITYALIVNLLNKSTDLFGWTSIDFFTVCWKTSLTEDRNYSSYYHPRVHYTSLSFSLVCELFSLLLFTNIFPFLDKRN